MTCFPTYMLMGMSAETFWGGVSRQQGLHRTHPANAAASTSPPAPPACRAALEHFGAQRISVFSPYQPIADEQVGDYFREAGFDVAAITGLRCPSATAIAEVGAGVNAATVAELDDDSVDAIVQVGTNLSFVKQAAELERTLGKPVIAINVATLWHALRGMRHR